MSSAQAHTVAHVHKRQMFKKYIKEMFILTWECFTDIKCLSHLEFNPQLRENEREKRAGEEERKEPSEEILKQMELMGKGRGQTSLLSVCPPSSRAILPLHGQCSLLLGSSPSSRALQWREGRKETWQCSSFQRESCNSCSFYRQVNSKEEGEPAKNSPAYLPPEHDRA